MKRFSLGSRLPMRLAFLVTTCVSLMAIAGPPTFAESDPPALDPVEQLFQDAPATAPFANNGGPSIAGQEPVSSLFGIEEESPHVAATPRRSSRIVESGRPSALERNHAGPRRFGPAWFHAGIE